MKKFLGTKYKVKIASYKENHFQNSSMTKGKLSRTVLVEKYKKLADLPTRDGMISLEEIKIGFPKVHLDQCLLW